MGVIDILHDWQAYIRSWSGNHRSSVKRSRSKLEAEAQVQLERGRDTTTKNCTSFWRPVLLSSTKDGREKAAHRCSVRLGCASITIKKRLMRHIGALDLWLLKLDNRIIAFEYCTFAKGTCFSHKISFDPEFDRLSPGKVLRCLQLEQYHQDPAAEWLDTLGVLCEFKAKWVTRTYRSSRCFVPSAARARICCCGATSRSAAWSIASNKARRKRTLPVRQPSRLATRPSSPKQFHDSKLRTGIATRRALSDGIATASTFGRSVASCAVEERRFRRPAA